jgi:tryptophan-rich sensory protein
MSFAGARAALTPDNSLAMALWSLQIALNTLWSPVFFGLKNLKLGLVVLIGLWLSVACTMFALWQVDWLAGLLFFPYLIWVTIAGALNASVWRLNLEASSQ